MKKISLFTGSVALGVAATFLPLAALAQTSVDATVNTGATVNTTSAMPADTSADATTNMHTRIGTRMLNASTTSSMKGANGANAKAKADQEVAARIDTLQKLSAKVGSLAHVSASAKSSLQANIATEVSELTTLKGTIDADATGATLKTDVQSITKDFRIYMLVVPQAHIEAAADGAVTIGNTMTALAPKLQARITEAQTAGKDMSAATAAYADMQAKIADANTQSSSAASAIASLSPDQGNATVEASNNTALKASAAKMKTAAADLKAARADISTILKAVKGTGSASASTSVSGSATVTH